MLYLGEISALVTAVFWSMSPLFFTAAINRVGTVTVNITRLGFALLFLFTSVCVMRYSVDLSFSQYAWLSISGFLGLVFGDSFMFKAFQHIGARITMLVMALSPAIAAFAAYVILGERMSMLGVIGIVVTLTGIIWVVVERSTQTKESPHAVTTIGLFYALCGATGQGTGLVFAKLAFQESGLNGLVATLIRIAAAFLILLPVAAISKNFRNPIVTYHTERRALWLTVGGAVVGPFLGITFSLIAVAHTHVGVAATIMATVPILMLPLLRIFYKERLTWKSIAGAFVAVSGVVLLFLK